MGNSVEHLTLDLSSGVSLRIMSSSPELGSTLGVEPMEGRKERKEKGRRKEGKKGRKEASKQERTNLNLIRLLFPTPRSNMSF